MYVSSRNACRMGLCCSAVAKVTSRQSDRLGASPTASTEPHPPNLAATRPSGGASIGRGGVGRGRRPPFARGGGAALRWAGCQCQAHVRLRCAAGANVGCPARRWWSGEWGNHPRPLPPSALGSLVTRCAALTAAGDTALGTASRGAATRWRDDQPRIVRHSPPHPHHTTPRAGGGGGGQPPPVPATPRYHQFPHG